VAEEEIFGRMPKLLYPPRLYFEVLREQPLPGGAAVGRLVDDGGSLSPGGFGLGD
jgi:hypothetical protein